MARALVALLLLAGVLLAPRAAFAQNGPTGNAGIDAGIAYYDDLEYEQAVAALEHALADPGLSVQEATVGLRVLALAYLALGREDDARVAFGRLLDLAPDYRLPATDNPRAIELLEGVRAARPARPAAGPARLDVTVAPARPTVGQAVTFTFAIEDAEQRSRRVVLYHRAAGGKSYSSIKTPAAARVTVTLPGAFVVAPGVEWYVVAETEDGRPVTGAGSPSAPRRLDVHERAAAATPVYKQWWFWGGIGGAVVVGAAAFLLLSDDGGGGADDASLIITIGD